MNDKKNQPNHYRLEISDDDDLPDHQGIYVEWNPEAQELLIGGWYDHGCDVGGEKPIDLREFFDRLHITQDDCRKVFGESDRLS